MIDNLIDIACTSWGIALAYFIVGIAITYVFIVFVKDKNWFIDDLYWAAVMTFLWIVLVPCYFVGKILPFLNNFIKELHDGNK